MHKGSALSETHFSNTFAEARQRFNDAAKAVGATICSHSIDMECEGELAIDVASIGADDAPTVVTSSGVHGTVKQSGSSSYDLTMIGLAATSDFSGHKLVQFNVDVGTS